MKEDSVAAVVCVLALLSHGLLATRRLCWRAKGLGSLAAWAGRYRTNFPFSSLCAQCSFPGQASRDDAGVVDEADILAECLAEEVQRKRHRLMCHGGKIMSKIMLLAVATNTCNALTSNERWMTLTQTILTCVGHQLNCFLDYGDHGARAQGDAILRIVFATQILIIGAIVLVASSEIHIIVYAWAVCVPMRFALSIFTLDTKFVSLVNASLSVMIGVAAYKSVPMPAELSQVTPKNFIMAEVCTLVFIVMCTRTCQEMAATSSKLAIESKASKSEAYAAVKVLNIRCDTVVQLDDQLRVVDRTAKLAALLLHGPGRVLTGSVFLQYLYGEDEKQSFRAWLEAPNGQLDEATGFESKLRDCTGNPVCVELFHVPFETVPGVWYHFIGIREKMADDAGRVRLGSGDVPQRPDRAWEAQCARLPGDIASGSFNTSEGSIHSNSTTPGDDDPAIQKIGGHPVFHFDAGSFRIIGCSLGFRLGDHALKSGSVLVDRLSKCDGNTEFLDAYADMIASLMSRARTSAEPVEDELAATIWFRPTACHEEFQLTGLTGRFSICARWLVHTHRFDEEKVPSMLATVIVESAVLEVHDGCCNSVASSQPQNEHSASSITSGSSFLHL